VQRQWSPPGKRRLPRSASNPPAYVLSAAGARAGRFSPLLAQGGRATASVARMRWCRGRFSSATRTSLALEIAGVARPALAARVGSRRRPRWPLPRGSVRSCAARQGSAPSGGAVEHSVQIFSRRLPPFSGLGPAVRGTFTAVNCWCGRSCPRMNGYGPGPRWREGPCWCRWPGRWCKSARRRNGPTGVMESCCVFLESKWTATLWEARLRASPNAVFRNTRWLEFCAGIQRRASHRDV